MNQYPYQSHYFPPVYPNTYYYDPYYYPYSPYPVYYPTTGPVFVQTILPGPSQNRSIPNIRPNQQESAICQICNKIVPWQPGNRTTKPSALLRHAKTHVYTTSCFCSECPFEGTRKIVLDHIKTVHQDSPKARFKKTNPFSDSSHVNLVWARRCFPNFAQIIEEYLIETPKKPMIKEITHNVMDNPFSEPDKTAEVLLEMPASSTLENQQTAKMEISSPNLQVASSMPVEEVIEQKPALPANTRPSLIEQQALTAELAHAQTEFQFLNAKNKKLIIRLGEAKAEEYHYKRKYHSLQLKLERIRLQIEERDEIFDSQ